MPTLYTHEIESYRSEVASLETQFSQAAHPAKGANLTQAAFAVSNRANLMVVGLCGLVEARMFEMAQDHKSQFQLSDIRGQGISQLKRYLKRVGAIDFGHLAHWDNFQSVYQIRNSIVHSYGGMVLDEPTEEIKNHFKKLKLPGSLVGGRRIRLGPTALRVILNVVDGLLDELGAYAT